MSVPAPRRLRQPGPARPERWLAAGGAVREAAFTLAPGLTLEAAITGPLRRAGITGGVVALSGGALWPFTYVTPALSADPRYAAFYSAPHTPPGRTGFERGVAILGEREGAPFIHCHALWREAQGRRGGHVMPQETVVREPIAAHAFGTGDALFRVLPDAETNFSLFTPVATGDAGPARRLLLLKVQPNEPLDGAILAACREHGIASASVHGVGSLVGARFADGREVASPATEVFLDRGRVRLGPDGEDIALDIALVAMDGTLHEGRLAPGNPVCITGELCVVED
ncbi:DNA-binding protein [Methylobacterium aerolatum]|uniref:DNA-binding protein with PD1-like motif n=1 Tax=Methylobacterium aerolatum TaxID=418708 RepID=A0ABU0I3I3_9HYPH|nr:DNA-binding protein [Methylobacterium aerolatum]MDQ0449168.1 putative DNA-binding protein with PD1-like motif [Methylobacterium aerolatum]GJD35355.1 hypothetical protein FMGBMHLM_2265 [Methylobacterium aerolatum]